MKHLLPKHTTQSEWPIGSSNKQTSIAALYAHGTYCSGQRLASEIVIKGLQERNWNVHSIRLPALERKTTNQRIKINILLISILNATPVLLYAWLQVLRLKPEYILYVSLGQTKFSMMREGIPFVLRYFFNNRKTTGIISLHGSNFMTWQYKDLEAKFLRMISGSANLISVLGPNQVTQLKELGITPNKIFVADNTCLIDSLNISRIKQKHTQTLTLNRPLNILFLSNLLEEKGYIQFIEAAYILSKEARETHRKLNFILCGKTIFSDNANLRFSNPELAQNWIKSQIKEINQSSQISLQWIDGAIGLQKQELFHQAHVFVFPSQYKTEAQPLVILEALASGCAVLTSRIGEIPSTVNEQTAYFLNDCLPQTIAQSVTEIANDEIKRITLAVNGLNLFQSRFSYQQHINRWEDLLQQLDSP
ncbi:glycosyltransferase family 4 protein [Acaryochloris marina]|uniref:glycosyltransferase family 4 protein n=1 Tax=Acaryochloris marina TaxID=155978 RepID=UPI001BB038DB|nr:glycosyltransferase family 4 protein [Acaryochloris marina]QUY43020.1 glycosyltransferase family 4 protein [Acaryochloris marina S15]